MTAPTNTHINWLKKCILRKYSSMSIILPNGLFIYTSRHYNNWISIGHTSYQAEIDILTSLLCITDEKVKTQIRLLINIRDEGYQMIFKLPNIKTGFN